MSDNEQQGLARREEFGMTEHRPMHETAAVAAAEQAKAAVQSRYMMAIRNPREMMAVRNKLLDECKRPGFAETAIYAKPVGAGKVRGFSIRFAEAAMRALGNLLPETFVVYDDEEKRILRIMVTDLEANLTFSKDVVVAKTVERKKLKEGQPHLGKRLNSYGKVVYEVRATEDDMLNKVNAQESKAMRNHVLRLLPGDILEECQAQVNETMADRSAKDPKADLKKLVDAFHTMGVKATDLVGYLGHDLDRIVPAELIELRRMFSALKDGEATWEDFVEVQDAVKDVQDPAHGKGAAAAKAGVKKQKTTVKQKAKPKAANKKTEQPPESTGDAEQVDPVIMAQQAYDAAINVPDINVYAINQVFKASALPVGVPWAEWEPEQVQYAIYILTEVFEAQGIPVMPNPPSHLNADNAEEWGMNYQQVLLDSQLIEKDQLL